MRNHKKLKRSIATALLMLFAGLVFAPTLVTAQFQAALKQVSALAPQATQMPTAPVAPQHERRIRPTAPIPHSDDELPVPQTEVEPMEHDQQGSADPTAVAVADFEPTQGGSPEFNPSDFGPIRGGGAASRGGARVPGGNIGKVMGKPNPPAPGNGPSENPPTDNTPAAPQPNESSSAPGTSQPNDSTPPADDKPDQVAIGDGYPEDDPRLDIPRDTPLVDSSDDPAPTAVPEPSSLVLLVAGIIGLVVARRRG
jgi:hypothetical protein